MTQSIRSIGVLAAASWLTMAMLVAFAPSPAHAQADYCREEPETRQVGEEQRTIKVLKADPASDCAKRAEAAFFIKDANCKCCGTCEVDDFVALGIEVSQFIFGIVGSLALLMFVVGGFWWLTSAGSSDRVKKGKDTMVHAVIGLLIVFGAWVLVNTILAMITGQSGAGPVQIFSGNWATVWSTRAAPDPALVPIPRSP